MVRAIFIQRRTSAGLKLIKLFGFDDFSVSKKSGKVFILTIYWYLIIIIIVVVVIIIISIIIILMSVTSSSGVFLLLTGYTLRELAIKINK